MLKFGCCIIKGTPDEVAALEDIGFDSLWIGGHIASRNPSPEAMMQLARVAGLAKRARIGTSILLLPLYPPAIVAKQIADLDRYTNGRITLGIGVGGEYEQEFRVCGIPVQERGRRTDEAIPLIRRLWTAERISHPGPFYPMNDVIIHPAPVQPGGPPIVVAGRKDPAMRRAALLGDGWMPYLYSPRRYGESVQKVRAFAAEAGRDLGNFQWMEYVFINVQDDGEKARKDTIDFLGGTYNQDFGPLVDRVAAAGNPQQVTARVQEFVDAGARHLIFMPGSKDDPVGMARRIMREIVPAIALPSAA
jgi:probable F420-dependent oxidoreductase